MKKISILIVSIFTLGVFGIANAQTNTDYKTKKSSDGFNFDTPNEINQNDKDHKIKKDNDHKFKEVNKLDQDMREKHEDRKINRDQRNNNKDFNFDSDNSSNGNLNSNDESFDFNSDKRNTNGDLEYLDGGRGKYNNDKKMDRETRRENTDM